MKQEMTRKEFLLLVTMASVSLLGFGNIVRLLTGKSLGVHGAISKTVGRSTGYNANSYNG